MGGDGAGIPKTIGSYTIQRVLGAGGMATVYAALQQSPRRTVALKLMRPGIASRSTLRRFKQEAEILAKLRHPYIAQIYDAGSYDDGGGGMPYFVMEYVSGASGIVEYATAQSLGVRDRLKLFVKVCSAVQHGHAQRIVHRDLKPGNILVDASGEPKIIDYGVARATETDMVQQTQVTDPGRLVGTVQFMSPEQVEGTSSNVEPASDVYALGVVLFMLLCSRAPYSLQGLPLFEAVRVIREDDPTHPSAIVPELRGDLETIMLKALEKDPARRYRDAGELGRDLLRYLGDQPIRARRAGPLHRARLFARRHRAGVIAVAAVVVAVTALAAGGAGLLWKYLEVDAAQRQMEERRAGPTQDLISATQAPAPVRAPRGRRFLRGHTGPVTDVRFNDDGSVAATVATDGRVIVWDVPRHRRQLEFPENEQVGFSLAMTSSGDRIVVGLEDGGVRLLDAEDATVAELSGGHTRSVRDVAMTPSGELVVTAGADATVRVWRNGREGRVLRGSSGGFHVVAIADEARRVFAGNERGMVERWRLPGGRSLPPWHVGREPIRALAVSADGRLTLAGTEDGRVQMQKRSGEEDEASVTWTVDAHGGPVTAIVLHPGGERVVTASSDGTARLWNLADGSMLDEFTHTRRRADDSIASVPIWSAAFDPTGEWLALGDDDAYVVLLPFDVSEDTVTSERAEPGMSGATAPPASGE